MAVVPIRVIIQQRNSNLLLLLFVSAFPCSKPDARYNDNIHREHRRQEDQCRWPGPGQDQAAAWQGSVSTCMLGNTMDDAELTTHSKAFADPRMMMNLPTRMCAEVTKAFFASFTYAR